MTTLATMKARIASELRRSNIDDQIADAISTAIAAYQGERFHFSESRAVTFTTVDDQEFYDGDDAASLALISKIDYVVIYQGDNEYTLKPRSPDELERLSQSGTNTGMPLFYGWYGNQLRLCPIPNEAWTVRIGCELAVAAPATDAEADNPWMTHAERLIRSRAKYELYEHVLLAPDMAARFDPDNENGPTGQAYSELKRRTNKRAAPGGFIIRPVEF
jgi:hypothetical protein